MTKIKMCGIRRESDARVLNEIMPDYAGFILAQGFRRTIDAETAASLRKTIDPAIQTVGVFVNDSIETIASFISSGTIDIVQLHGNEDNAFIANLRAVIGTTPIIKALKIRSRADAALAEASAADLVLLDNGTGTGETFDWTILSEGISRPFFLAGGLNCENARTALDMCKPYGVDVSSGIETDHAKDPNKMREFAKIIREYN